MFSIEEYIGLLDLRKLTKISDNKYISSCPICKEGSHKNRKRFSILKGYDGNWIVKCLNCGYVKSFGNFLKEFHPDLYERYIFQFNMPLPSDNQFDVPKSEIRSGIDFSSILNGFPVLNSLPEDHPARAYMKRRAIPDRYFNIFRFAGTFGSICKIVDLLFPNTIDFKYDGLDFPCVLIPIYDMYGSLNYIQARNLMKSADMRYMTIKLNKTAKKIWGMDKLDFDSEIFVFEGVLDAVFVDNSIAMLGSTIADLPDGIDRSNLIFVVDNEYNKPEMHKICNSIIEAGCKLVMWPTDNKYKDLNDMIINKIIGIEDVRDYIMSNVRSGVMANLDLQMRRQK